MKRIRIAISIALPILGVFQAANAQNISDPKIVTYIQPIPGWNMRDEFSVLNYLYMPTIGGLGNDKILGIKTIIHPDNNLEAFDLTRQTGFRDNRSEGRPWRNGGYTELFRFDRQAGATNDFLAFLDRGSCESDDPAACADFAGRNFFTASYPALTSRTFTGTATNRGKVKIDYVCTANCPASMTKTMWLKLDTWNMDAVPSRTFNPSGISPANVANMDAVIYSDPGSGPQVDNLEHIAFKMRMTSNNDPLTPQYRGRGGILWFGKGCGPECMGQETGESRLRLYAGHGGSAVTAKKSSYRGMSYIGIPEEGSITIPYTSTGLANRGWAKIEYTGAASSASQPYFIRTKAFALGPWSMPTTFEASIPFSGSGIDPYRITGLSTIIRSDKEDCGPSCMPGWTFTNFHRPDIGHKPQYSAKTGGVTYLDGKAGVIRVVMSFVGSGNEENYYVQNPHYSDIRDLNGQAYNRGYVRVDYLAADCQDGTGGYTRGIIGSFSANTDDCHGVKGTGTAANFVIQTKGPTLSTASDALYFAHKSKPYGTYFTATAKVMELENSGSAAKAGVMMRLNTNTTSYQASVVVTGNSVQFIRRAINGTSITTVNNVTAPCWVRVEKSFDTYKGFYSLNGTNWTRIGPDANITTSGGFLVGLVATGSGLTTSGFTNVSF
jgi:hypothetical protein